MTADASMSQQIKEVLATYLKRDPTTILPEHNLREDLGLDSLMTFELLYDLEKSFDLEIPNEDLPGLQTIADVVKYLEARISPEALQNVRSPSSTTPQAAPLTTTAGIPNPASQPKLRERGKAGKPSTAKPKAKAKPTLKSKPRASQKVMNPKQGATMTTHKRTTQKKTKKK